MEEPDRFIRLKELLLLTGLSRPTIYRHVASGVFPAGYLIGRCRVWSMREVVEWQRRLTEGSPRR
ncbi:MAG: AlpA family phage regulatory protein [Brevundimonas sp.]|nr:AlpA family phage regulatory protein [Brevundimonas sp.]